MAYSLASRSSSLQSSASRISNATGAGAAAVPNSPCWPDSRIVDRRQHALARTQRIHCSGLDQALEDPLVQETRFDALAEFVQRPKFSGIQTRFADRLRGVLAHIFYRGKAETDGLADGS